jgi:hypothetical protein
MQRLLPLIFAGCLLVPCTCSSVSAKADVVRVNVANLQQQLESGLRARTKADFAFIKKVVAMVSADTLPLSLVKGTFQWTRKNPEAQKYPLIYFQRALRERAKKIGVTV